MKELLKKSIIKCILFAAFDEFGPMPKYTFPNPVTDKEKKESEEQVYTIRDYTQMAIKMLSLLMEDQVATRNENFSNVKYFAIIPYPDFKITALAFFHFIWIEGKTNPIPSAFAIMVDENQRSFLYNNISAIQTIIFDLFIKFDEDIINGFRPVEELEHHYIDLLEKMIKIEKFPIAPITSERKLKIIFLGLDAAGKTSFLLTVDRKYSRLIGLKPTRGASISTIEALGATISLWDLGGQAKFRERYISKSKIYLYEADLLFFFIDVRNKDRFDESIEYLKKIKERLSHFNQKTPILYVLTKADPDIINSKKIQKNIQLAKSKIKVLSGDEDPEIHVTSIFSIFSILRAFSSGISNLSPNRDMINYNLKGFSEKNKIFLSLILTDDGLVLADYYSNSYVLLTEFLEFEEIALESEEYEERKIRDVFEITAPQFAIIYKIFSKFKALKKEEALFKISHSVILIKRVIVLGNELFILILIDDENKKIEIDNSLNDFLNRNKELLLRYIS
ncbi:MAG: ADP-ribosylation factor-like protein [Promethearchaeota archaeon]